MSNEAGIQLLPESRKEIEVKIPGENNLIYFGLGVIGVVLVVFGGLYYYSISLQGKVSLLDAEFQALETQRSKEAEKNILTVKDQMADVGRIIDNHPVWSYFLKKIQSKTSPQFKFETMGISFGDGQISFEAETLNYTILARQIASYLSEDIVEDVRLEEAKLSTTGRVRVVMKILLNTDDIILKTINKEQDEF